MSITNKNYPEHYSKQYIDVIDTLAISKTPSIKGTFSMKGMLYPADVDGFDKIKMSYGTDKQAVEQAYKEFKKVIVKILHTNNLIVSKILAGSENGKPKQWKVKEVFNPEFEDTITVPSLIKIDVVAYVDSIYTDFSMTYQFYNNGKLLNGYKLFQEKSLNDDIKKFKDEGKFYKMAKRQFVKTGDKKYIPLFNGDAGLLNQVVSNIDSLIFVIENSSVLPLRKIQNEIDILINRVNLVAGRNILTRSLHNDWLKKCETTTSKNKLITLLEKVKDSYNTIINNDTKEYLKI